MWENTVNDEKQQRIFEWMAALVGLPLKSFSYLNHTCSSDSFNARSANEKKSEAHTAIALSVEPEFPGNTEMRNVLTLIEANWIPRSASWRMADLKLEIKIYSQTFSQKTKISCVSLQFAVESFERNHSHSSSVNVIFCVAQVHIFFEVLCQF